MQDVEPNPDANPTAVAKPLFLTEPEQNVTGIGHFIFNPSRNEMEILCGSYWIVGKRFGVRNCEPYLSFADGGAKSVNVWDGGINGAVTTKQVAAILRQSNVNETVKNIYRYVWHSSASAN